MESRLTTGRVQKKFFQMRWETLAFTLPVAYVNQSLKN